MAQRWINESSQPILVTAGGGDFLFQPRNNGEWGVQTLVGKKETTNKWTGDTRAHKTRQTVIAQKYLLPDRKTPIWVYGGKVLNTEDPPPQGAKPAPHAPNWKDIADDIAPYIESAARKHPALKRDTAVIADVSRTISQLEKRKEEAEAAAQAAEKRAKDLEERYMAMVAKAEKAIASKDKDLKEKAEKL